MAITISLEYEDGHPVKGAEENSFSWPEGGTVEGLVEMVSYDDFPRIATIDPWGYTRYSSSEMPAFLLEITRLRNEIGASDTPRTNMIELLEKAAVMCADIPSSFLAFHGD